MALLIVRDGDKFGPEYTKMLRGMVGELTCLGEDRPLSKNYGDWWCKQEIFAPWNEDLRPCVYVDLDTYILGDISDLFIDTEDLWLIRDFYNPDRSNSGVMIVPRETTEIWELFQRPHNFRGDGDLLNSLPHKIIQDHFDGITSYKVHNRPSRIVCFHGKPKPHQVEAGWAKDVWDKWTN